MAPGLAMGCLILVQRAQIAIVNSTAIGRSIKLEVSAHVGNQISVPSQPPYAFITRHLNTNYTSYKNFPTGVMISSSSNYEDMVSIDANHIDLIASLIKASKSRNILELGFGSGACTKAIVSAINYNSVPVSYDIVDNWYDKQGQGWAVPESLSPYIKFHNTSENSYVFSCQKKYDFILSDADHFNSNKWFDRVYNDLLSMNGILIYHDVTQKDFQNLHDIYTACVEFKIPHMLFNRNSRPLERCDRGLLVIQKTFGVAPRLIPQGCMI